MKNQVTILLDSELKKVLERRAKKEMLSFEELIADILRRSAVSYSKNSSLIQDKVDDKFLTYFSRKSKKAKI